MAELGAIHIFVENKATIPFRFKASNTCEIMWRSEKAWVKENNWDQLLAGPLRWRTGGATRHPDEAQIRWSIESVVTEGNSRYSTCLQRRRPISNAPPLWPRMRSNPTSMARSKMISWMKLTMMLSLLLAELNTIQPGRIASHSARSCKLISIAIKAEVSYLPGRHLIQYQVNKVFTIDCRQRSGRTCLGS